MSLVFSALSKRLPAPTAYNVGFAVYWLGWCLAFPLWTLGPRRALTLLRSGKTPSAWELGLLLIPVAGGVGTQLVPRRRLVDPPVAATMLSTAVVNAVGEELLWRGVFVEHFDEDVVLGALWPLAGFSLWHLAPQQVLPSALGRWRFVLGAAVVGSASTISAWRNKGLRNCLVPHALTDACGVTAARFRLGRSQRAGEAASG